MSRNDKLFSKNQPSEKLNPVKNVLLKLLPAENPKEEKKVLEIEDDEPLDKITEERTVKADHCELPIPKAYA